MSLSPLRLLLVEDSDDDADLLMYRLRDAALQFELHRVQTESEFRQALKSPLDMVISDYSLPQFSGPAALGILKEEGLEIPLIIISGAIGEESAVAAMRDGAVDYILKDRLGRLPQAIVQGVASARMHRRLQAKQKNLEEALARLERMAVEVVNTQEQERKNLARELHDELGQKLTALNLILHRIQPSLADEQGRSAWRQAEHEVSSIIGQVRNLSASLRPPALDIFGLEVSICRMLERHFGNTGTGYMLEYAGVPDKLGSAIEITAYRLVQESITNVTRHARAKNVVIEVNGGATGEELEIIVRDDGIGFDLDDLRGNAASGLSHGLTGMRERVELLGGAFDIDTQPGGGTRITASLPLVRTQR